MSKPEFSLDFGEVPENLKKLQQKSPGAFNQSLKVAGQEFLRWCANGSTNDDSKPPIHEGFLRGSGSAFVGSELIGMTEGNNRDANKTFSAGQETLLTVGYNSTYAEKMHEKNYEARRDGGRKWLENHIANDRNALYKVVSIQFEKELGKSLPKGVI